ncbi:hypothetical protein HRbin32_01477 [bacterium HR32]|jgi:tetratricopeptide (TPR) repeat protein|nr:hypothetical protein HRbin32_01477 [bacterium HR32]
MRGLGAAALVLLMLLGVAPAGGGQDLSAVYPSEQAFAAATAGLRQRAQENPRDPDVRYRLGLAYFSVWRQFEAGLVPYGRGYDRAAEAEFRAALQAAPGHLGSLLALYSLLRLRGQWEEAEALLRSIVRAALPPSATGGAAR